MVQILTGGGGGGGDTCALNIVQIQGKHFCILSSIVVD